MNFFILSTLEIGATTISLLRKRVEIAGVIGLTDRPKTDKISGYRYLKPFCDEQGLPFYGVESYSLKKENDRKQVEALEIDVLFVGGWQRLIPVWLIEHCRKCAIGAHGSPFGITKGRGRSPQVWSLLLGQTEFHQSIFQITEGIDSGPIIGTRSFRLEDYDDIGSCFDKSTWATALMVSESLLDGSIERGQFEPQTGDAGYLPQRIPSDGGIDWGRSSKEVFDFVRALTRPYPGAFFSKAGQTVHIWRVKPFEISIGEDYQPGEVIGRASAGAPIVKTGDSAVVLEDYSLASGEHGPRGLIEVGEVLPSVDFRAQMSEIVTRHREKHPKLELNPAIIDLTC